MLTPVLRAVRGLSLGAWFGGGIMTFIAAHYVFFGGFIERGTAGDIMGAILHAGGLLKLGLAALALGAHFGLGDAAASGPKARKTGLVTLLIATVIALVVAFYLEPKMLELRGQFRGDADLNNPAHLLFAKLHGGSMGAALLELLCIGVALVCAVI